jgi:hypothetical protein
MAVKYKNDMPIGLVVISDAENIGVAASGTGGFALTGERCAP